MSVQHDGGPAFARPAGSHHGGSQAGVSLRDYAAIHADLSKVDFPDLTTVAEYVGEPVPDDYFGMLRMAAKAQSKLRYELADAMLAAREVRS